MPLLNRVYHIIRERSRIDTIGNLIDAQSKSRAVRPAVIVLENVRGAEARKYSYAKDPRPMCTLSSPEFEPIELHVFRGNFEHDQGEEVYFNAFASFGKFIWAGLKAAPRSQATDALSALFREMVSGHNIFHCHSLALSLLMANKPHCVENPGVIPGVILSPHYQNPDRSRLMLDFILGHKQGLHPSLFVRLRDILRDRQAPGTIKQIFDDKGILYYGLPQNEGQLDFLLAAYLEAAHGTDYDFSTDLTTRATPEQPVFDRVYILTPEREGGGAQVKGAYISDALRSDPLLQKTINPDGIKVIGLANTQTAGADIFPWSKIRGNLAGYVALMERAIAEAGNDERCLACVNEGGTSTRSPLESSKGSIGSGESQLRSVGLTSGLHAARQLPDEGKGWLFLMSCDNRNFGKGPLMVGESLLQHTPFKFLLFQKAHKAKRLERFVNRGVSIVDHKTGAIMVFAEKLKQPRLKELVDLHEAATIYENTMWQAVHISVARRIVKLYRERSRASGAPLIEHYPLDFSMDLVTPLQKERSTLDKAQFAGSLEKRCREAGIAFEQRDADRLFDIAQEIARMTYGVGSVKVGTFFDEGDLPTLQETGAALISSTTPATDKTAARRANTNKRLMGRKKGKALTNLLRITSGMSVGDEWIANRRDIYVVPKGGTPRPDMVNVLDKDTTYIGDKVALAPGTVVSPHTMITGTTVIPTAQVLPPHLLITGCQLEGQVEFTSAVDANHKNLWRILYHINLKKDEGFELPNGGAAVGYLLPEPGVDDPRYVGFWPIDVDLKQARVNPNCTISRSQIPPAEFDQVKELFVDPSQETLTFKPGLKRSAFDSLDQSVSAETKSLLQPPDLYEKDNVFGVYDLDGSIHDGQFVHGLPVNWLQALEILRRSPTTSA